MTSLIDNVISLEQEADSLVEAAQARSRDILASVDDELARYRTELADELESRLARFNAEAEKKFEESLAQATGRHAERLRVIRELPEEFSVLQVDRILDRFSNW